MDFFKSKSKNKTELYINPTFNDSLFFILKMTSYPINKTQFITFNIWIVILRYLILPLFLRFTKIGIKFLNLEYNQAKFDVIRADKTYIKHITDSVVANGPNLDTTANTELCLGHFFALERSTYPASLRRRSGQDGLRVITS